MQDTLMLALPPDSDPIVEMIREKSGKEGNFERRTGIIRATPTRWYKGTSYPRAESFLLLAGALDLDFMALLEPSAEQITELACPMRRPGFPVCGWQVAGYLAARPIETPSEWLGPSALRYCLGNELGE